MLVTICNPDRVFDGDSFFQRRQLPPEARPDRTFTWTKTLPSGAQRHDVHRPRAELERDLRARGFVVEHAEESPSVSLEELSDSSDFLALLLRKTSSSPTSRRPSPPKVLCYHRVLPSDASDDLADFHRERGMVVSTRTFERHLEMLADEFEVISVRTYLDWLLGRASVPERAVVLTFDDGYRDFLEEALPRLSRHGFACALFPVRAGAVHSESTPSLTPAWTPVDELYLVLAAARRGGLPEAEIASLAFGTEKYRFLRSSPEQQRLQLDQLTARYGASQLGPESIYLAADELATLPPAVTLGAHGTRHQLMTTQSWKELRDTMVESRAWLRSLRDEPLDASLLAYPSGAHDELVRAAARTTGFLAALGVVPSTDDRALFSLPRICVPDDHGFMASLGVGEKP